MTNRTFNHILSIEDLTSKPGYCRVSTRSNFSGNTNSRDIPTYAVKIKDWMDGNDNIQDVLPNISADDREFLLTGITQEEWNTIFEGVEKD